MKPDPTTLALYDVHTLVESVLNDLGALFSALSDRHKDDLTTKGVAGCGAYLCDDWRGTIEQELRSVAEAAGMLESFDKFVDQQYVKRALENYPESAANPDAALLYKFIGEDPVIPPAH